MDATTAGLMDHPRRVGTYDLIIKTIIIKKIRTTISIN